MQIVLLAVAILVLIVVVGVIKNRWSPLGGLLGIFLLAFLFLGGRVAYPYIEHYAHVVWDLGDRHPYDDDEPKTNQADPPAEAAKPTEDATEQASSCLSNAQKALVSQADLPDSIENAAGNMTEDDALCDTVRTAVSAIGSADSVSTESALDSITVNSTGTNGSSTDVGVAHVYQWATGDILGDGSCYMQVSGPDQPLNLPPKHGTVAQGDFTAGSPEVYDQRVQQFQSAAINDPHNKAHSCPMVKS